MKIISTGLDMLVVLTYGFNIVKKTCWIISMFNSLKMCCFFFIFIFFNKLRLAMKMDFLQPCERWDHRVNKIEPPLILPKAALMKEDYPVSIVAWGVACGISYCCGTWIPLPKFKSCKEASSGQSGPLLNWMSLFVFHRVLINLRKAWIQLFSL